MVRWTEQAGGASYGALRWSGPELVDAPGLESWLGFAQDFNGYVHLFARRRREKADGTVAVDVVHATQYQPGKALLGWRSLGNPLKDETATEIGVPVAAVDGTGALHVMVHRHGTGLMARHQPAGGSWTTWSSLEGRWVRDPGVLTVIGPTCRMEFLAPYRGGAVHWLQQQPGAPYRWGSKLGVDAEPGSVAAFDSGQDRMTCLWRDASSGMLLAFRPPGAGRPPEGPFVIDPVAESGGLGPVAAQRALIDGYDYTVLARTRPDGTVLFAAYATGYEQAGVWWSELGGPSAAGPPALAFDARGLLVVALVSQDGRLWTTRQKNTGGGLSFEKWTTT
ncbi:hypothetical protein ACFQLX_09430 [Streptomyces polyrhachis]|uniref:Uncharacterized protein n=1 Tax=Streptomyces polyrhachis TaxID=1282885 RepID=A0ABW2GFQ0_9ACTN